jgi:nicotinamidase/pyrazinamidase
MTALILVDIQNDFLEYGALAVPDGNAVIAVANEIMPQYDIVVATQDWHPANHGSFAANHLWRKPGQIIELDGLSQILWPIHCVQNSYGALFAKDLHTDRIHKIFQKGTDVNIDSYSGFYDNGHRKSTGMGEYLQAQGVTEVTVMGLATDYCVKFTALDALSFGFKTTFLERGSRGVNLQPDDVQNAIAEMREKGVASPDPSR